MCLHGLKSHVHKVFCTLGGWEDGNGVSATQQDENGSLQFWTTGSKGAKLLTPVWEHTFSQNFSVWGAKFLVQCHEELIMSTVHRDYLKKLTDEELKTMLYECAWKSFLQNGKQKAKGVFNEKQLVKQAATCENSWQGTVSVCL
jgi:hypothetical protein